MKFPLIVKKHQLAVQIESLARLIGATQLPDGRIPWSVGDKTDPWDHVESAMGLTIGGCHEQARGAYEWLKSAQLPDGSWYAAYGTDRIEDKTRETNHAAYIAVGIFHYLLVTGDRAFADAMWPAVKRAIDFVLRWQATSGEVYWALNPAGEVDPMALLTGSCSVLMSLKCAIAMGRRLGRATPGWSCAARRLSAVIAHQPHRFNMTKARFSMDWFYPVLCGAVTGRQAHDRITRCWKKFVIQGMGARCVSDQPWVTIAESSELVLALCAMGNRFLAHLLFSWISDHTFEDGTFWCGFTFPDMVLWPEEKITWTNAVVLMAADALFDLTPAGQMFSHRFWQAPAQRWKS